MSKKQSQLMMRLDFLRNHKIKILSIKKIKPYSNNVKRHPKEQIIKIANSIRQYGYVQPIVVDRNFTIIIGHGRYEALKLIGVDKVPVIIADLSEEEARALRIADNRLSEISLWDELNLQVELSFLQESGMLGKLELGFVDKEIEKLLISVESVDMSENFNATDIAKETITQKGDIWHLGKHKLICGDSADRETYKRLLGSEKINTIVTSPPYALQRVNEYGGIPASEYPEWFCKVADCVYDFLHDNGSFFINIREHTENGERSLYFYETLFKLRARGWKYIDDFIWVKSGFVGEYPNRLKDRHEDIHWLVKTDVVDFVLLQVDTEFFKEGIVEGQLVIDSYERVFHIAKQTKIKWRPRQAGKIGEKKAQVSGLRRNKSTTGNVGMLGIIRRKYGVVLPSNVLVMSANQERWPHPAMFPVDLPAFFIRLTTVKGDIVADIFSGAGTTLIACEKLDRIFRGIEIKPEYCDLTVRRFLQLKNGDDKNIFLERNGRLISYKEVKNE